MILLKVNAASFASTIGVNKGTFHNVVSGRLSKPSAETVAGILRVYPQVRSEWLLGGEAPMLFPGTMLSVDINLTDNSPVKVELQKGENAKAELSKSASQQASAVEQPDHDDAIPFVPIAAEGSYLQGFADEEYIEHMPKFYLPFLGLGQGVYAFQVRGDSMSDRFNNGDVVFGQKVEQNDALRWGEVYVLLCNDGLVVKELRRGPDDKHFTLRSYNEHFDPYDILKSEVRQLYRYQASISFNSSNPNRGGVVNFMKALSEQMGQVQNSLNNLPSVK